MATSIFYFIFGCALVCFSFLLFDRVIKNAGIFMGLSLSLLCIFGGLYFIATAF